MPLPDSLIEMSVEERLARIEGILEQMDKRINDLVHRIDRLKSRIDRLEDRVGRLEDRMLSQFKWTVGLIITMWATVMCTLIPILLKLLGVL